MCSVGGPMDIEIPEFESRNYVCKECGERFQSESEPPICPACGSDNVSEE